MSSDVGTVSTGVRTPASGDAGICIHHGGHCFVTTRERASVFLRRVQALCDENSSELVPLLHQNGIDLLFISASIPLQVHDIRDESYHRTPAA